MSYFLPYFDLICALFPWNHESKIAIWNNLESIIFKIFPTAPTMVVPLKILQTLSPLNLELLRGPLFCYCLSSKGKSCALAAENLLCPTGARLKSWCHLKYWSEGNVKKMFTIFKLLFCCIQLYIIVTPLSVTWFSKIPVQIQGRQHDFQSV